MLSILSPAKTMDFEGPLLTRRGTTPQFAEVAAELAGKLKRFSARQLSGLMEVNEDLARQTRQRYAEWTDDSKDASARPAIVAYKGDVYLGLDVATFRPVDFDFAQDHLRIISGLYGVLRPLDRIQPYRLEMGTPLAMPRCEDLYDFWGDRITEALADAMQGIDADVLVNLASAEYFKSVRPERLPARVITPVFKQEQRGQLRVLGLFAKRARGHMASYIIRNQITDPERLKRFTDEGYRYRAEESTDDEWVFTRSA